MSGEDYKNAKAQADKRNALIGGLSLIVLLVGLYFWVIAPAMHAPQQRVAKPDPQLMTAPAPAPSPTPTKAGKKDTKATPAMVSPVTGKPADAAAAPDKDLKPRFNLH